VSISDARAVEGALLTFTVSLSAAPGTGNSVSVTYATAPGSAGAADFLAVSPTVLTFGPSETVKTISVDTVDDTIKENLETVVINLSDVSSNATVADSQGVGTIVDDDNTHPFSISVSDAWVQEGNNGLTPISFTVSVSPPPVGLQRVTVDVATAAGGPRQASTSDYTALPRQTLRFDANTASQSVTTTVKGDTTPEPTETFLLRLLSSSANAVIADSWGVGTIVDDDNNTPVPPPPSVYVSDARAMEGDRLSFVVSLSNPPSYGQTASVSYRTINGSATSNDYVPLPMTTLTFGAGETAKTVSASTTDDTFHESSEVFRLDISNPVNAAIADNTGIGTIIDDESLKPFSISVGDMSAIEGNNLDSNRMAFVIAVQPPPVGTQTVSVNARTVAGGPNPAQAGSDYSAVGLTSLTFTAASPTATINVPIVGDVTMESNETFLLVLSSPSANATIGDGTGLATVVDDDVTTPIRVMALGDSITEATCNFIDRMPSYRRYLWDDLASGGNLNNIDLVGSRWGLRGPDNLSQCDPGGTWDKDNEGHSGWRSDQIVNGNNDQPQSGSVAQWAATAHPDVILIHLGTNDVLQGYPTDWSINYLGQAIDALQAANPSVKILLAQIIPTIENPDHHDATVDLNAAIPALASAKSTPTSPVVVVDQHTGFDPAWTDDGTHPMSTGQQQIAQRFYQALVDNHFLIPPIT
jgi:lysophospholipase L1-like esterase